MEEIFVLLQFDKFFEGWWKIPIEQWLFYQFQILPVILVDFSICDSRDWSTCIYMISKICTILAWGCKRVTGFFMEAFCMAEGNTIFHRAIFQRYFARSLWPLWKTLCFGIGQWLSFENNNQSHKSKTNLICRCFLNIQHWPIAKHRFFLPGFEVSGKVTVEILKTLNPSHFLF